MSPPPRRPPELMEEVVEEVLLRFPPDDPAGLVRAALVSKRWCRLISGRGFRRRFRELHRAAPLLGFVCNVRRNLEVGSPDNARFVPTCFLPRADRREWRALDARHGRILLYHWCAAAAASSAVGAVLWGLFVAVQSALLSSPDVAGYANGLGVIFIATEDGFFTIATKKSNQARKVGEGIVYLRDGDVDCGYGHNFYTVVRQASTSQHCKLPLFQWDQVRVRLRNEELSLL